MLVLLVVLALVLVVVLALVLVVRLRRTRVLLVVLLVLLAVAWVWLRWPELQVRPEPQEVARSAAVGRTAAIMEARVSSSSKRLNRSTSAQLVKLARQASGSSKSAHRKATAGD